METSVSAPANAPGRKGTPGIDIFKIAGKSISGWVPSRKTGDLVRVKIPYASKVEQRLSLYLEYHPHVRTYQRGDVSKDFVEAYNLATPLETPRKIKYVYDGTEHDYLPDYIGTLVDGKLLIAEAGLEDEKSTGKPLAKAEAARNIAKERGGVYWIGTEKNLPLSLHHNLVYLHGRRESFKTFHEIAPVLFANWPWGEFRTVKEFVKLLGSRWSEDEVEATVWKIVGDAAAEGRLLFNLTDFELSLSVPLALLDPTAPPILPDPLPSSLEADEQDEHSPPANGGSDAPLEVGSVIPGPTIDTSDMEEEERKKFNNKLTAATRVLSGESLRQVAEDCSMSAPTLSRLVKRVTELGQIACVSYGVYQRIVPLPLHPEFQEQIRKMYTQPLRPTIKAIHESLELQDLAAKLTTELGGDPVLGPSYRQVTYYIESISKEMGVIEARSGIKHPPRDKMSPYSYMLSIPFPAEECQVDEHPMDLFIVAQDGTPITRRVHAAVMVCVKTGAILAGVLSLDSLKEEDYMRLVKQAMEKKDELVKRFDCKHSWPCYGKPSVIFHDRGKIFVSERARSVLVDRFKIITGQAPPYAPSAKGTVEAIFGWMTDKFEHRLAGTTKASPSDRGAYDSLREAEKAGITFDLLEQCFFQAIVDDYMQNWNKLRRQKPTVLWEHTVKEKGVPKWLGSKDDLKLLLMKAVNRMNKTTGRYKLKPYQGLSFLGRRYVNKPLLNMLVGKEITIYYDRRDIRVIYLFLEGKYVGEAYCPEFMGKRVSIWEANALRKADTAPKKEAEAESLAGRQRTQRQARRGGRAHRRELLQLEKQRQMDRQQEDIHPEHVQTKLKELSQQKSPTSPPARTTLAPSALPEPDDELEKRPIIHLPMRRWNE
jgi:Mu transposase-like protein